jgi:ring-1,2-phenylacetyl-CoA epoxidase subunit PaaC
MRETWLDTVIPRLEGLDLDVPDPDETALPDARGRDGTHTDAWFDLQESFTATYREIQPDEPATLSSEEV